MTFYSGNTPGLFDNPDEYSWWICGAMFMELIEYWNLTGDDEYNDLVYKGLVAQVGPDEDYRPSDQVWSEANDDQLYWGLAAMTAAEHNFKKPSGGMSWLGLAQAVFNRITVEWDDKTCDGGFRWQYSHKTTSDWFYKNTPTNGAYFQIAARLAAYTGNSTNADWAEKTWDWFTNTPSFEEGNAQKGFTVWDGVNVKSDCKKPTETYWTYNYGTMINGAAYMWRYYQGNAQKQNLWKSRLQSLITGASHPFFPTDQQYGGGKYMVEWNCELSNSCNTDQPTFKGYLIRWLTTAMIIVDDDDISGQIEDWLRQNAIGAAQQCTGDSNMCGLKWFDATYDGTTGVGQQMSAMSLFANNIVRLTQDRSDFMPLTLNTGGNSESDPSAGTGPETTPSVPGLSETSIWDKIKKPVIGAVVGLIVLILLIVAFFLWRKYYRKPKASYKGMSDDANISTPRLHDPHAQAPQYGYVR
jgi:mannan endo-1,6-alpha-mannosidase